MRLFLFTILILIGCRTDQEINFKQTQNSMKPTSCIDILKNDSISINSNIDFSKCDLKTLLTSFDLSIADSVKGSLGKNQIPLSMWSTTTKAGIEITFWAKSEELVKIDVSRPYRASNDVSTFKEINGEATVRLDYFFDVIKMQNLAALYPDKGMIIFYEINEESVYKWSYFKACSANYYEENFHPVNAPREFEEH